MLPQRAAEQQHEPSLPSFPGPEPRQVIVTVIAPGIVKEIGPGAVTVAVDHPCWSLPRRKELGQKQNIPKKSSQAPSQHRGTGLPGSGSVSEHGRTAPRKWLAPAPRGTGPLQTPRTPHCSPPRAPVGTRQRGLCHASHPQSSQNAEEPFQRQESLKQHSDLHLAAAAGLGELVLLTVCCQGSGSLLPTPGTLPHTQPCLIKHCCSALVELSLLSLIRRVGRLKGKCTTGNPS